VSVEQTNRINALLKRCYRYGYVDKIHCMSDLLNLNSVDLTLFDKCILRLTVSILCFLQSEINWDICTVGRMTLLYPHVPKIFTRDHLSCVVCLTLCNNHTIVFVLLYYHTTQSFFSCKFYYVSPYFYMFYSVYYHVCVCHVSINITYLLTRKTVNHLSTYQDFAQSNFVDVRNNITTKPNCAE